jgi:hypothetical protein
MTKTMTEEAVARLAAALDAHERAKTERKPEDNPFHDHDLKQMASAGLRSAQDKQPARNMAAAGGTGLAMEEARFEVEKAHKADKSAKRMAAARARAARKVELDKIADSPVRPSTERMQQAWMIVLHLTPTIDRIANDKRRWASRFLGTTMDDVPQMAKEKMALILAKSNKDLDLLETAARELGEQAKRSNRIPADQLTDEERIERKKVGKARKWLMGVVNNRVMGALVDAYTSERNLRWDNIDLIATVMANINGPGADPIGNAFKADRAPAFMGTRFQRPGGVDPHLLATAINAAITERKLDRLVELLLNNIRTDGSFPWSEQAEEVFLAAPDGDGQWYWQAVCNATTGRNRDGKEWTLDRARKARGDAARTFVRNEFEWLPGFIVEAVEAFDPHAIGYSVKANRWSSQVRATLASDFELYYLGDEPEVRQPLRPVLRYADAAEAARALMDHLACLVTGEELVRTARDA